MQETQRCYLSINDIQREYIPMSKKVIRKFVIGQLPYKRIGASEQPRFFITNLTDELHF